MNQILVSGVEITINRLRWWWGEGFGLIPLGWIARMPGHQISCVPQQIPLVLRVECLGTCIHFCSFYEPCSELQHICALPQAAAILDSECQLICQVCVGPTALLRAWTIVFCTAVFVSNAIHRHPVYSAQGWKYMKIQHDYCFYVLRFPFIRLILTLITLCLFWCFFFPTLALGSCLNHI